MFTTKTQIVGSHLHPAVQADTPAPRGGQLVAPAPATWTYRIGKRVLDVSLALLLLILLSPLLLLIAVAIKLDDRGPVFIVQKRVGLGGKVFDFYKFRSMTANVDHVQAHKAFALKVVRGEITKGPPSNGGVIKPTSDGRVITRVGRILRKTSMDELPQLVNVLIGNMSLVGPRPSMDYELEAYYDWYLPRLSVLPGITGLAQINGRSSIAFPEIVRWDLKYIENRSLWQDVVIILKTIPLVISMRDSG
ncbi:MAG: sugar transferase [Caldilineae bacterium]|nr:MAG: sugar transferase [Caldilineae bacterium]